MGQNADSSLTRARHVVALTARYAAALARYNLVLPFTDRPAVRRFAAAVLQHDFLRGSGRRLPSVGIADVFPEIRQQTWTMVGVAWSEETPYLGGVLRAIGGRTVVEIGTYEGAMTIQLAANVPPDGRVVTVDIAPDEVAHAVAPAGGSDRRLTAKPIDRIGRLYRDTPYAARITQLVQDSATVDYRAHVDAIDLVYIDGGHSYAQVRIDTEKVLPLMRSGGALFWHDYQPGAVGVTRYLHELARRYPLRHLRRTQLAVLRVE
jgi:predicted O-methyltransferase YrrM